MSSGGDLGVTRRHIYSKLTAAAALSGLTIVEGITDDDAPDTFVAFEYLPEDRPMTMGTGATYLFTRPRYKVVVVGKNVPFSALDAYAVGIYTALHNISSTASDGTCSTLCVAPLQLEEPEDGGVRYRQAGWIVEAYTRSV